MEKRKRGAKNGTFEALGGYQGGGLPKYHTFAISLLKFRVGISKKKKDDSVNLYNERDKPSRREFIISVPMQHLQR